MSAEQAKKTGRPSRFSPRLAAAICDEIACGKSLRKISAMPGMPGMTTILRWLGRHESFRGQYARARELQAEVLADEVVDIADDATKDWLPEAGAEGSVAGVTPNHEQIQRSRLRVDARKWFAARLAPRKYGDRQIHENVYPEGLPVQRVEQTNTVLDVADMTRVDQKTAMDMYKRLMMGGEGAINSAAPPANSEDVEGGKA